MPTSLGQETEKSAPERANEGAQRTHGVQPDLLCTTLTSTTKQQAGSLCRSHLLHAGVSLLYVSIQCQEVNGV